MSIPSDLNDFKRVNFNVSVQYVQTFNLFSEWLMNNLYVISNFDTHFSFMDLVLDWMNQ